MTTESKIRELLNLGFHMHLKRAEVSFETELALTRANDPLFISFIRVLDSDTLDNVLDLEIQKCKEYLNDKQRR